jgi:hypothetical protein
VYDVHKIPLDGHADRPDPSGGSRVCECKTAAAGLENRDFMAAGVDNEKPATVFAEDDSTLVAQAVARAEASRRIRTREVQRAVSKAIVGHDIVAGRRVGHGVDGSGFAPRLPGKHGQWYEGQKQDRQVDWDG